MEMRALARDPVEHPPERRHHAEFVDRPHVGDADPPRRHQRTFAGIDRSQPEQVDVGGGQWLRDRLGEQAWKARLAAQGGERHAVHVPGGRGRRRVEVGMGVEPEHEDGSAMPRTVPQHAVDGAQGQAVIAPGRQRKRPGIEGALDDP